MTKECINRYFKVLYDLKIRGYKVVGWGGHPSTTSGHNSNEFCPVYGDCLQRNKVSKYWNECIKELCEKESIPFISIMDELIDEENGLTKMEYFIDYCHLKSTMVIDMILKKLELVLNVKL